MNHKKEIIFDTNAIRNLALKLNRLSDNELNIEINRIKICLNKSNYQVVVNFWVLCELLNHLENVEDSVYYNCKSALDIMLRLSSNEGRVWFKPTFDYSVTVKYNNPKKLNYKNIEQSISKLAIEFSENGRTNFFEENIHKVKDYLDSFKKHRLDSLDKVKEILYSEGKKNIPTNEDILHYYIIAGRVASLLGVDYETIDMAFIEELNNENYFCWSRSIKILSKAYGSETTNPKFLNNFIDASICEGIPIDGTSILVTNDGLTKDGILKTFKEKGYENLALTLDTFLEQIGYQ